jgi:hypothetical protein
VKQIVENASFNNYMVHYGNGTDRGSCNFLVEGDFLTKFFLEVELVFHSSEAKREYCFTERKKSHVTNQRFFLEKT